VSILELKFKQEVMSYEDLSPQKKSSSRMDESFVGLS
jgi:hypothetical protein